MKPLLESREESEVKSEEQTVVAARCSIINMMLHCHICNDKQVCYSPGSWFKPPTDAKWYCPTCVRSRQSEKKKKGRKRKKTS